MIQLSSLWLCLDRVTVCGYIYDAEGKYLAGTELAQYFGGVQDSADFQQRLRQANGCFAVIIRLQDAILAGVDKTRSFPLFYRISEGNLQMADKSETLAPLSLSVIRKGDKDILSEYLITGYVSGIDTLNPEIKQIPAGCYLQYAQEVKLTKYYTYQHQQAKEHSPEVLCQQLHQVHINIAMRLIASLKGRTAVIPLSGGYDSRLIAWLLKSLEYPKIIAFTYDAPGNPEAKISKRIAKHLGIPWIFVPHTRTSWYDAFWSKERKEFYSYAVNSSSSAHIQDWLAVKTMQEQELIPSDSVFVPGHSADFLQGSHLPAEFAIGHSFSKSELISQIVKSHYRLWPNPGKDDVFAFAKRIETVIDIPEKMDGFTAASLYEQWDFSQRQAKFIINSLRVYESFGYEWRLPLWDTEMLDFWSAIPLQYRPSRKLWHRYRQAYPVLSMPAFQFIPEWHIRLGQKVIRSIFGKIWDVRYARFAPYRNPIQYANQRVGNFLREGIEYPDFVKPERPLLKTDMNAIQALISIYELPE